jgi:hypothetical protein
MNALATHKFKNSNAGGVTYHAPVEVVVADVAEGAEAGVEGAVAAARVAGLELEVVDGDVAAVPPTLNETFVTDV